MPRSDAAVLTLVLALPLATVARADDGGTRAEAERSLQSYLAMWSSDARVTAATVERFYAPQVVYYGKSFSRAKVLADKQAFIRSYPVRDYREVPGTFAGSCNDDRSRCHVSAEVAWRRVDRHGVASTGRARLGFDFIPIDGGRKIARESARLLGVDRG